MRTLLLLILVVRAYSVSAQSGPRDNLEIRFDPGPSEDQEKRLFETLNDHLPSARWRFDRSASRLTIRSDEAFSAEEVLALCSGLGLTAAQDQPSIALERPTERMTIDAPGFPRYIDTGNSEADDLRYQEAKRLWIAEDPARYQELIKPEE